MIIVVGEDRKSREGYAEALERRFGRDYEVLTDSSPAESLSKLAKIRDQGKQVALIVADQSAAGSEFLIRTRSVFPEAKRLCITWYDNPEYSTRLAGLMHGQIDYFVPTFWSSPEHEIYPVVQELLSEWADSHLPHFEAIKVIGSRASTRSFEFRDLLKRANIPFGYYSSSSAAGRQMLEEAGVSDEQLPVVILWNGSVMVDPPNAAVARALGVAVTANPKRLFDLVIAGAGPAGLAAAVYASSEGLRAAVVEPETFGGQAGTTSMIRNYLGFPRGITGARLAARAYDQAELFGTKFIFTQRAVGIEPAGDERLVRLSAGDWVRSRTVLVATGVTYRRLSVPALEGLLGRGVFYGAAVTEAPAMRGKAVFVVGGGNSAGQAATYVSRFAEHVTLLVRGASLGASMSDYLIREMKLAPNLDIRYQTEVVDAFGDTEIERLKLRDAASGESSWVPASAVYVLIGAAPNTQWISGTLHQDAAGYIATGQDLPRSSWPLGRSPLPFETSMPGVFAVGDVRSRSVQRVAAAVGDGSTAVRFIHEYLSLLPR